MDAVGPPPDLRIAIEPRAIARRLALPAAFAAIVAGVLLVADGPLQAFADALRRALSADPLWVVAAVGFELASFAGYVALLWLVKERFGLREPGWPDGPDGEEGLFRPDWAFQDFAGRPDPKELAGFMFALHPQGDRLAAYGIFAFPFSPGVANKGRTAPADPLRSIFIDSGLVVVRDVTRGKPVLNLAVKGGHNGEPHGHHDQGSYVIAVDGWPLLLDPGAELYTPATFDRRRYRSMMNNSLGHPVPLVAGKPQLAGAAARSVMSHASAGDDREVITLDLTACYDVPELKKLTRTFSFLRKEQRIEIVDEAEFLEPRSFGTAFVTNSTWRERAPGEFTVSDPGVALEVVVKSDTGELEASSQPVTAPQQKPGIAPMRLGYTLREPALVARIKATVTVRADAADGL